MTHLISCHVSTFNAAVNPVYLSFFTGEPALLGRSFRNTSNWHAWRDSNPHLTGSKPAALNPLSYKRLAESRAALHAASKLNPYESLGLASHVSNAVVGPWPTYFPKNLEEGGGFEPLSISQYQGVGVPLFLGIKPCLSPKTAPSIW